MEQQLQVAQEERNELIKTLLEMRQELDTFRNRPVPCQHHSLANGEPATGAKTKENA